MKKLLVVIDYQNDFVNGSLGSRKQWPWKTILQILSRNTIITTMMLFLLMTLIKKII